MKDAHMQNADQAAKVTKFMLDFMFYSGILLCLALPAVMKILSAYY
ncbi:MAG TPA: hypothetical protein PLU43_07680 [Lachnospiraceae bacterium]|nr:hypothetical protein [Lachnospiraceae bacterium]